jgi:hypothetical protein
MICNIKLVIIPAQIDNNIAIPTGKVAIVEPNKTREIVWVFWRTKIANEPRKRAIINNLN